MSQVFFERLARRAREIDSLLCIGLDPRVDPSLDQDAAMTAMVEQNKALVEATMDVALAYKPNIAFYEAQGEAGLMALRTTLGLIPDHIPVILDAKRGDIGATSEAYAQAAFSQWNVEAITVAPYMGSDSVQPFATDPSRGVFVLCKTSNPGSKDFQQLLVQEPGKGGQAVPLYIQTARTVARWEGQFGLVVGGNDPEALRAVRAELPETWILAPGIGAQGGTIKEAVQAGLGIDGLGILLVMARSIAAAPDPAAEARRSLEEFRAARDQVMGNRRLHGKTASANRLQQGLDGDSPVASLRHELLKGLVETACFKTGEFTLKSGLKSPFYVDLRRVMSNVRVLRLAGRAYASLIKEIWQTTGIKFDRIAGIPVAALPLATAASLETGIPMIFPRLQVKDHGTGNLIEGEYKAGERILLLDDLITTGKSKVEALEILRNAGLKVDHLVVLIERGHKGRADMESAGVHLHSFADIRDFLPVGSAMGVIDEPTQRAVEAYLSEESKG